MLNTNRNKQRNKQLSKIGVDWVFVGDGPREGIAYRHAISHPEQKVIVIDPLNQEYDSPPNLRYIQMDALSWLKSRPGESVSNVRDDFAVEPITYRCASSDMVKQAIITGDVLRAYCEAVLHKKSFPKGTPNIRKNRYLYVGLIHKVLRPNGKFVLTTNFMKNVGYIDELLIKRGFAVKIEELDEEQIINYESSMAICSFKEGEKVYKIIATKH